MYRPALTSLALLVLLSAPQAAYACMNGMMIVSYETFPLDFLWLGNLVTATGLLFWGGRLIDRRWMHRAVAASGLMFGAGMGLFLSNTLALDWGFQAISALVVAFVLGNFRITRSRSELLMLSGFVAVAALVSLDTVEDTQRYEAFGDPPRFVVDPVSHGVTF